MPTHKVHRAIDRLLFGKEFPNVHRYADLILGKGHRKKWGHSIFHTTLLYLLTKRKEYALSHMAHVMADRLESKNKKLFRLLELLAKKKL